MSQLKRRDILKIGALAAGGLAFPAILRAQSKEIVILGLWDQTGAFADVGPLNDRGMRMALEERDMKVLGRPIRYVTRDGATQAGTSTRRAEEAVDGEGARFIVGPWSSGVALAVSEVAKRKKVLVPEKAVIVSFTPTDRSELKPGVQVFVNSQRQPDGSLTAARVNVGLKGQVPPM